MEIMSPVGNYLLTYLTFPPKAILFPVTRFAFSPASSFCLLLPDISFYPGIVTAAPHQQLKIMSLYEAAIFPPSLPLQLLVLNTDDKAVK